MKKMQLFLSLILLTFLNTASALVSVPKFNTKKFSNSNSQLLKKASFALTQTRYLSPIDIIQLFDNRFPGFIKSVTPAYQNVEEQDFFYGLLGENSAQTGVPQQSQPSPGLMVKLETSLVNYFQSEVYFIQNKTIGLPVESEAGFQDRRSGVLKMMIPCYGSGCIEKSVNWEQIFLKDLKAEEKKIFIAELLKLVWIDLDIYEELNTGDKLDELIISLAAEYDNQSLRAVYQKIQIWAGLRDELLLY